MSDRHKDWPVRLEIDPSAWVAPGAIVVGEVAIGARSSIWFNTVVRGDSERIEIGDDTNVQDNSTVHVDEGMPAIVGHRVTVGHRAIVHGCVIEDDVLVGMGAVILSGARIGAGSLIGASALVKERDVIPPGSLVLGAPAKVVGEVRDAHRAAIAEGAKHYAELARTYVERGIGTVTARTARGAAAYPRDLRPMDFMEWKWRMAELRSGPAIAGEQLVGSSVGAFRRSPGPGRWCALEVFAHLRDCDREVLLPRLKRVLAEDCPAIADVPVAGWASARHWRDEDPAAVIGSWREARREAMALLEPLGPREWQRTYVHQLRGPQTLADLARDWSEHDLSHRRQWCEALGPSA
jgi:carbonic anhydrase/acetyltransferase-like protein (isoleucine patch superfamily)